MGDSECQLGNTPVFKEEVSVHYSAFTIYVLEKEKQYLLRLLFLGLEKSVAIYDKNTIIFKKKNSDVQIFNECWLICMLAGVSITVNGV